MFDHDVLVLDERGPGVLLAGSSMVTSISNYIHRSKDPDALEREVRRWTRSMNQARSDFADATPPAGHPKLGEFLSINYTWTLDSSLSSEHNVEALRDLMAHNLERIKHVLDNGYIVLCGYRVNCGCIVGGDSPWLRHVFGLSVWFGVGSLYTYAMLDAASNQWLHTTRVCSWKGHKIFLQHLSTESAKSYPVRCLWVHPPSSFEGAGPVFFNCHVPFALLNFCGQGDRDLRAPLRQEGGTGRAC